MGLAIGATWGCLQSKLRISVGVLSCTLGVVPMSFGAPFRGFGDV